MAPRAGTPKTPKKKPDLRVVGDEGAPPPAAENPNGQLGANAPPGALTQDQKDDLQLVHMARMRKDNELLENALSAVKAVRKQRTLYRAEVRGDGFPLTLMDEVLEDELLPLHEVAEREEARARIRGVANQPGGSLQQGDLFDDSFQRAEEVKKRWGDHGYTAGLRGLEQTPDKHGVPQEHHQLWLERWSDGQARLGQAFVSKHQIDGSDIPPEFANAVGRPGPEAEGAENPPPPPSDDDGAGAEAPKETEDA
jgi:hypothetical protein